MKYYKYLIICLIFYCLKSNSAVGQTEYREGFFRIGYLKKIKADSAVAVLYFGKKHGLDIGYVGAVKGVYKENDDRSDFELGFTNIIYLTDSAAVVSIRPKDTTWKKPNDIRKGDYVVMRFKVPKLPNRSFFFDLSLLDIDFKNISNEPLYDFYSLLTKDSKQFEDSLLKACAADVKETYDMFKNDTSSKYASLREIIPEGRYKGKSTLDVMGSCSKNDIYTFLAFVYSFPGKYSGASWKINETFATWVMNKAPFGKTEIIDSVLTYKNNKKLLSEFLHNNKAYILKYEIVRKWVNIYYEFIELKEIEKANKYLAATKLVLPILNDDNSFGFYHYILAQTLQDDSKYQDAINQCDSSITYFKKANNNYYYFVVATKKGYNLRMLKKYDVAIQTYNTIINETIALSTTLPKSEVQHLIQTNYTFLGYCFNDKGDYKNAIDALQKAIPVLKEINNYDSRKTLNTVQTVMADIYKNQGEYAKAILIYEDQLDNNIYTGNKVKEADARDNLGFIQSKLGNYRASLDYHKSALNMHLILKDNSDAGYSLSQMGQSYWNSGNYDSAILSHKKAIEYRTKSNSYSGIAYSWKKLGSLYNLVGKKADALNTYDSVAYYYTLAKDSTKLIENLLDVGEVYKKDKQYQKANNYFLQAYQLNVARKNKSDILNSLSKLAGNLFALDSAEARKKYLEVYKLAVEIGSKVEALYANLNLGLLAYRNYEYNLGQQYFNKALNYCYSENNKSEEAYCYHKIGNAYRWKFENEKSLQYLNKSIYIYDSLNEKSALPEIYSSKANTLYAMGKFSEAQNTFYTAINLAYENKSLGEAGNSLNQLSFIFLMAGDINRSIQVSDSALHIFESLQNNWQLADSYVTKGNIFNQKEEYKDAVESYLKADSIYLIDNETTSRSTCFNNIGNVYFFQSDYDKALQFFFESEKQLKPIKVISESHVLAKLNIGETYFHKKDFKNAEKYLTEGFELAKSKKIIRYTASGNLLLGKLTFETKKYKESEEFLKKAVEQYLDFNEVTGYVESYLYLGKVMNAIKKEDDAIQYLKKSIYYSTQKSVHKYLWESYYELGLVFYNKQQFDSSCHYLKLAASASEKTAEKLFGGSDAKKLYNADYRRVDIYTKLVAGFVNLKKTDEALYYADRSNVQGIKEQLSVAGLNTDNQEKKNAILKSSELLQKFNAIEKTIAQEKQKPTAEQNKQLLASLESVKEVSQKDYTNFINDLVIKYPDLQSYFTNTNPADFKNYIDFIPDSTMVILYVINDNQLLIFSVTNQNTNIKTIDLSSDLNQKAGKFLTLLNNPKIASGTKPINVRSNKLLTPKATEGDFRKEASDLYDLLITPIKDNLKDINKLCIIPNGKLSNIPFQSLGYFNSNKEFTFLIEEFSIFYTNKMDVFIKPFKNNSMQNSFVAFGNPDKSLPKATTEVQNLSKIIQTAQLYIEDNATEDKAKSSLENFKYIHFATHGILDYNNIQESYLLFKKNDNEDGRLSIKEINGLNIKGCDLVTLSACETAVAKETVKGWYISPANSFLANRVKTVVASLWPVDDDATSILMTSFYENLQTMPKAIALRKAQEKLSHTPGFSHPYFWSAFVLYGDWR